MSSAKKRCCAGVRTLAVTGAPAAAQRRAARQRRRQSRPPSSRCVQFSNRRPVKQLLRREAHTALMHGRSPEAPESNRRSRRSCRRGQPSAFCTACQTSASTVSTAPCGASPAAVTTGRPPVRATPRDRPAVRSDRQARECHELRGHHIVGQLRGKRRTHGSLSSKVAPSRITTNVASRRRPSCSIASVSACATGPAAHRRTHLAGFDAIAANLPPGRRYGRGT